MNDRAAPPTAPGVPSPRPPAMVSGRDREFLPAALEILETPPAPLPVAMMLTICAFVAAALVWCFIGRLDVHAVAPGKIESAGRAKVIQPLEPGKIASIHVENGARVKVGDVLLALDPAEAAADENAQRDGLNASLAEIARRRFAVRAVSAIQRAALASAARESGEGSARTGSISIASAVENAAAEIDRNIAWDDALPDAFRLRDSAVVAADLTQLSDTLKSLDKQMAQKEATRERLRMSIAFQDMLMETLIQRVDTRQQAIDLKVGTKINLYDAKEELEKSQSTRASDKGELIETDAAVEELQSEKIKTLSQFIADNENKLSEAARKADEAREALAKAAARLARATLRAPIDGVVQQLAVTTLGQVVTTGQQLMVVTPSEGPLQVEALVANIDVGFVKIGRDVAIKVDAFPFTRFGVLRGKVIRIATEAVDEQEAKRALANATSPANGAASAPASAPGQPESYVFPVTVALDATTMNIDGTPFPLTPGMTVSAEIKTDSRRVIDYLLSPLAKLASEAMKER